MTSLWTQNFNAIKQREITSYISSWDTIQNLVENLPQGFEAIPYQENFYRAKVVTLIWRSNKFETSSHGATQEVIMLTIENLFGTSPPNVFDQEYLNTLKSTSKWDSEGCDNGSGEEWQSMGIQAARAYFLLSQAAKQKKDYWGK